MDLSRFSINPALASAAGADDGFRSAFFDKILSSLFEKDENVYIKTDLSKDRDLVFVFPALYWLSSRPKLSQKARALYLCEDDETARSVARVAAELCGKTPGLGSPALLLAESRDQGAMLCPETAFVVASVEGFRAAAADEALRAELAPRSFGFVIADQAERIAERPGEEQRKTFGFLLPSWERKTLVVASKASPKAKNFAWDFADNPKEIKLGEAIGKAVTMPTLTYESTEGDKIRFILKLLGEEKSARLCVFCNLKSTAAELSIRLGMNGVETDYIAGNLNVERKKQIVAKALRHPGRFALVLTDEGAKGIEKPGFTVLVNYDIPLEPELYFDRISILEADNPESTLYNLACERYMYGLPAIKRSLDASLELLPLEGLGELPADASAGQRIELPEPRRRFDRDRGRDRDRDRGPRRDEGRRDERGRDSRGRDDRGRERGPELRDRQERRDRSERPAERGMERGSNNNSNRAPRPEAHQETANPYSMSMEERMELYRRKYGRKAVEPSGRADKGQTGKEIEG